MLFLLWLVVVSVVSGLRVNAEGSEGNRVLSASVWCSICLRIDDQCKVCAMDVADLFHPLINQDLASRTRLGGISFRWCCEKAVFQDSGKRAAYDV